MNDVVTYQYWTGTQWLPTEINVGPVMSTGWHIFHVLFTIMSFGLWLPVYLIFYFAAKADHTAQLRAVNEEVADYYERLEKRMNQ